MLSIASILYMYFFAVRIMALHQKPIKYQDLSDRLAPYAY